MPIQIKVLAVDEDVESCVEKVLVFDSLEEISVEKCKEQAFGLPVIDKDELQYASLNFDDYQLKQQRHQSWGIFLPGGLISFLEWVPVKNVQDLDNLRSGCYLRLLRKSKKKKEKDRKSVSLEKERGTNGLFGLPLEEVIIKQNIAKLEGANFPIILQEGIEWMRSKKAVKEEGLFRLSANSNDMALLKQEYDKHGSVDLHSIPDLSPHTVAGTVKSFFRELPEPLIPFKYYSPLLAIVKGGDDIKTQIRNILSILNELPKLNRDVLVYTLKFLKEVSNNAEINKMSPSNLAVCLAPNLLREPLDVKNSNQFADITYINAVISCLIEHYDTLKLLEPHLESASAKKRMSLGPTIQEMRVNGNKKGAGGTAPHYSDVDIEVQKKLAKAMLLANVSALRKTEKTAPVHSFDSLPTLKVKGPDEEKKRLSLEVTTNLGLPSKFKWAVTVLDSEKWGTLFTKTDANKDGFVEKNEYIASLGTLGNVDTSLAEKIWNLADREHDSKLDKKEFTVAMFVYDAVKSKGQELPTELPPDLLNSVYRGSNIGGQVSPGFQLNRKSTSLSVGAESRSKPVAQEPTQVDFRSVLKKPISPTPIRSNPPSGAPVQQVTLKPTNNLVKPPPVINSQPPLVTNSQPLPVFPKVTIQPDVDLLAEEEALRREEEELQRQEELLLAELARQEKELQALTLPPPPDFDYIRPPSPPPGYQ